MNESTKKWYLHRKLDLIFLCLEAIAVTFLGFMLMFNFYVFVVTLKIYASFAVFIGILELIETKVPQVAKIKHRILKAAKQKYMRHVDEKMAEQIVTNK